MQRAAMAAMVKQEKKYKQQNHSLRLKESRLQLVQDLLGRILESPDP